MAIRPVIIKPYVRMNVILPIQQHIRVPQELLQMPKGAVLKIGYRLLELGGPPRQTLGYLIPGVGIYAPSGRMVKELKGSRGLTFYDDEPVKLRIRSGSMLTEVMLYDEIRFAVDKKSKDIVGVLRTVDPQFNPEIHFRTRSK